MHTYVCVYIYIYILAEVYVFYQWQKYGLGESSHSIGAEGHDFDIELSKCEFQSHFYVHFWISTLGESIIFFFSTMG